MSEDRALRQELETLQQAGKELRAELSVPHAPAFLGSREQLQRELAAEAPVLVRDEKLALAATTREAELTTAIDHARTALAAAEQRRLSPALGLLPFAAVGLFCFLVQDANSLLRDKTFAEVVATLSALAAGLVVGARGWASPGVPTRAGVWSAFSTHLFFNGAAWAPVALAGSWVLLIAGGSNFSHQRLLSFVDMAWCQAAALTAFALALHASTTRIAAHQALARIETALSGATLLATMLWGNALITNTWFNGGGLFTKVALGVAVTTPLLVAAGWYWFFRKDRQRPLAAWVVPGVLSMVATSLLAANVAGGSLEPRDVREQTTSYVAGEAPRVPPVLLRDEAEFSTVGEQLAEANRRVRFEDARQEVTCKRGGRCPPSDRTTTMELGQVAQQRSAEHRQIFTRRSFDVSAFLLAVQFGLICLLGAWFANGRQPWWMRALSLVPLALLAGAVLVRGG
ncbi:MAG: hypothetical protein Q8L48_32855 [Archangium sp.]|nr:hypothetical protein [Archangium sp.]